MRDLVYLPVIHAQADLGRLAESVREISIQTLGLRKWKHNVKAIDRFWENVRREIDTWDLPWGQVRLYQDGLPVCGKETQIVTDLARSGSQNHGLLLHLMEKGATLMGTESPDLLLEEYGLAQCVLAASNPDEAARIRRRQRALSEDLLSRRDQFIASRIHETLGPSDTGILFIGMLHSVEPWLAKDIRVSCPIGRPAARRSPRPG